MAPAPCDFFLTYSRAPHEPRSQTDGPVASIDNEGATRRGQLVPFRKGHQHHVSDVAGSLNVCYREEGMPVLEFANNTQRLFQKQTQRRKKRLLILVLLK